MHPETRHTLPTGLYEKIVSEELRQILQQLEGFRATTAELDPEEGHFLLIQYLSELMAAVLRAFPRKDRIGRQVALVNRIVEVLEDEAPGALSGSDHATSEVLRAVHAARSEGLAEAAPPPRPGISLAQSELLVNARGEYRIGRELEREIRSADRIDLLCSFIKWSGLRLLIGSLRRFLEDGKALRVITTVYMGATDRRALDTLVRLGAQVRISYDTRRTRLHAKAWLLQRETGFSTAYIGSSNLSAAAQVDGLEWNVRVSGVDAPRIVRKFEATFDAYWDDPEFVPYEGTQEERTLLDRALGSQAPAEDAESLALFDIRPYPFQQEILERLAAERAVHQRTRNLVVAATGTGKTVVAALDYRRLCAEHSPRTLLFVAHRKEILEQSRRVFRHVLREPGFGELYVAGRRPERGSHVFASVQSLSRLDLESLSPNAFDVLIIDEFHHAAAPTYERLLRHFRPEILLGLTATPERADGQSILHWFDDRIAAELRLWDAIDRGLLAPFQYFGTGDETDLSQVRWRRGRYDDGELTALYTGDDLRARKVIDALRDRVADSRRMRAIGFCVGVEHARFMAARFGAAGIPSLAVTGQTPRPERDQAIGRLRGREVNVLFTVDLFNEGVDIPEVDTVLFLRPTESATVFLQQLGRGLRLHDEKECLTVLDFIGAARKEFRFDLRYRALIGTTRRGLQRQIEAGFPLLPSGCAIQLDRESREVVLANIRKSLGSHRSTLVRELRRLGPGTDLGAFLREAGIDRYELYRGGRFFSDLRRAAGLEVPRSGPEEDRLGRALGRLLHVDEPDRIRFCGRVLHPSFDPDALDEHSRRRLMMLLCVLYGPGAAGDLRGFHARLLEHPAICQELGELLAVLSSDVSHVPQRADLPADVPLALHCSYGRDEIMAAFGDVRKGALRQPREGVVFHAPTRCNLLFVTLNKSERDYSPSTMYEDYAVSAEFFHWQSQSTTRAETGKGRRHTEHGSLGVTPLLFVRQNRKSEHGATAPYVFLGPLQYVSHEGERPMNILWRVLTPIPADYLRQARVAA